MCLKCSDIWPLDFYFALQTTFKNFPDKFMFSKVTLRNQVTLISWFILPKVEPSASQSWTTKIQFQNITATKNLKYTSHEPILRSEAGKFEALSLSAAAVAALLSLFTPELTFSFCCAVPWESFIWIKSNREGLFLRRKPKGLGSSRIFRLEGELTEASLEALHCYTIGHTNNTKFQPLQLNNTKRLLYDMEKYS